MANPKLTEEEIKEITTSIHQGLHRNDPEYLEAIKCITLLIIAAKGKEEKFASLIPRFGRLFSKLLKADGKMMQADILFTLMMAIAEGAKHDAS